jgi:hypothetical protein
MAGVLTVGSKGTAPWELLAKLTLFQDRVIGTSMQTSSSPCSLDLILNHGTDNFSNHHRKVHLSHAIAEGLVTVRRVFGKFRALYFIPNTGNFVIPPVPPPSLQVNAVVP